MIAGIFRGVQFSWIRNLLTFCDSNFADAHNRANTFNMKVTCLFAGLIFTVYQDSTVKTVKIGPLKNFLLYGTSHIPLPVNSFELAY